MMAFVQEQEDLSSLRQRTHHRMLLSLAYSELESQAGPVCHTPSLLRPHL